MSPRRSALFTLLVTVAVTGALCRDAHASPADLEACANAYEKGQALRDARKLRDSRAELVTCAREVCPGALRKDCLRWVDEVDRSLGSIVFRVVGADGGDELAAEVTLDGEPTARGVDGWAVTVDPGRHVLRATAPGRLPAEQTVVVGEGEKNRAVVLRLEAPPPAPARSPIVAPITPPEDRTARPLPAAAWISGGISLVGLGAFAYLGLTGTAELGTLQDECGTVRQCSQSEVDSVRTQLLLGDVAGVIGVVAAGVLTYVLVDHFSSRSRPAARSSWPTATFAF